MNNLERKQELIDKMAELNRLIPDTIEAVEFLPMEVMDKVGANLYQTTPPGELNMDMAYNVKNYSFLRRNLKGWKFTNRNFHKTLGSWFMEFEHKFLPNIRLSIELELIGNLEGQSCRIVKVSEIVEPVYKLECK